MQKFRFGHKGLKNDEQDLLQWVDLFFILAALIAAGTWVAYASHLASVNATSPDLQKVGLADGATTLKKAVTVQAEGRGKPYFNLRNGHEIEVEYRGDWSLTEALKFDLAQPRSLASLDIDRDGTPDVVAGYSYNGAGLLTIQHGNPDAFAPKSEDVFARINQGYNPDSLLPVADVVQIPEAVDFLQVGDFNHDNQRDVLVAAKGGGLFLLAGDGQGGFATPERIPYRAV